MKMCVPETSEKGRSITLQNGCDGVLCFKGNHKLKGCNRNVVEQREPVGCHPDTNFIGIAGKYIQEVLLHCMSGKVFCLVHYKFLKVTTHPQNHSE